MSLGLTLILGAQCVLIIMIGWLEYRNRSASQGNRYPRYGGSEGSANSAEVGRLLTAASKALAEHADELDVFENSLDRQAPSEDRGDAFPLTEQVEQIRCANKDIEQTVDSTIAGLIAACGDLLSQEQSNLKAYQNKTGAFDRALAGLNPEALLAGIASKLLDMVHELRDENKAIREEVAAAKDRTIELMTLAHAAEQDARVDPLTQLPNRRAFDEAHAKCSSSLERNGQPYCLILLDIDHFKLMNDQFGHSAGDAILSMIGRILRDSRRTSDHVCRLGGEEFGLLLPECDQESGRLAAERLRQKIELARLRYRDQELSVTVSCGVAQAVVSETKSRLLQRADSALYAAKLRGRNATCVARDAESGQGSSVQQGVTS